MATMMIPSGSVLRATLRFHAGMQRCLDVAHHHNPEDIGALRAAALQGVTCRCPMCVLYVVGFDEVFSSIIGRPVRRRTTVDWKMGPVKHGRQF